MPRYSVAVDAKMWRAEEVEADSPEEAMEKAEEQAQRWADDQLESFGGWRATEVMEI